MNQTITSLTIAIGADHRGFAHKQAIQEHQQFDNILISWIDVGCESPERSDYPLFAQRVCHEILAGKASFGILICGTGVGMAIAANRHQGIYAGLVCCADMARRSREEDGTNIMVIPADYVDRDAALALIHAWLSASFKGGRYAERLAMIDDHSKSSCLL